MLDNAGEYNLQDRWSLSLENVHHRRTYSHMSS